MIRISDLAPDAWTPIAVRVPAGLVDAWDWRMSPHDQSVLRMAHAAGRMELLARRAQTRPGPSPRPPLPTLDAAAASAGPCCQVLTGVPAGPVGGGGGRVSERMTLGEACDVLDDAGVSYLAISDGGSRFVIAGRRVTRPEFMRYAEDVRLRCADAPAEGVT